VSQWVGTIPKQQADAHWTGSVAGPVERGPLVAVHGFDVSRLMLPPLTNPHAGGEDDIECRGEDGCERAPRAIGAGDVRCREEKLRRTQSRPVASQGPHSRHVAGFAMSGRRPVRGSGQPVRRRPRHMPRTAAPSSCAATRVANDIHRQFRTHVGPDGDLREVHTALRLDSQLAERSGHGGKCLEQLLGETPTRR
jgi:hypothetical protein